MLFAYVDESGDPTGDPAFRGSPSYTLGVVLVPAAQWPDAFDSLINLRRELKRNLSIPARAEIKASYLVRNEGVFTKLGLSSKQRRYVYFRHLTNLSKAGMRAFAIFVDKRELAVRGRLSSTRELAWNSLFQRLSKLHDHDRPGEKSPILLVHDEGEDLTIRKLARRARRYLTAGSAYGTGPIRLSARWLLDDPVSRQSHHSLFIQCADLVAYAATKHLIPGGRRQTRVCPPSAWSQLGPACYEEANSLARRMDPTLPPGIVIRRY